jgi:hypothetical protein
MLVGLNLEEEHIPLSQITFNIVDTLIFFIYIWSNFTEVDFGQN